ncbi:MAG: hypothetical protein AAGU15_08505 [Anaerolineaceae bacterium]|jgi:hypothetical protein
MTENEVKKVVTRLMGKDVLSYRLREDGFLVVINHQGWKVTFSPTEVEKALQSRRRRPETKHD